MLLADNPRPAPASRLRLIARSVLTAPSVFAHLTCISCLMLQRFGTTSAGGQQLFASLVVCPILIAWLLVTHRARIQASTALLFSIAVAAFLISALGGVLFPEPAMRFSIMSLGELLLLYACLTVEPADGFDSAVILRVFCFYARLLALAALAQYALQFVGVRLFSFADLAPSLRPFLTESGYHVVAPIAYGSPVLRSNGFVLLEPSILSQVLALGVLVDYFVLGRIRFLPAYAAAALSTFSGTGPLSLALTLAITGLTSPRQIGRTALFVTIAVAVGAAAAVFFPTEFATLAARASGSDPSSRLRYATQLDVLNTILNDPRVVIGFGPGAADGYIQTQHVQGSMSPALKLFFDYGLLGLIAFAMFLLKAFWRPGQPILTVGCLVLFQFGGGYLVFAPMLFLFALLCIWSRPVQRPAGAGARPTYVSAAGAA